MAGDVHEVEVFGTDKLDFRSVEETVVIFADESSVLDGFLGEILDVCFRTYDTHITWVFMMTLIRQCDMLANQHSDTYSRHVKAIQERLYVIVNLHPLSFPLVLQYSLRNSRHHTIVPPLDLIQRIRKPFIVIL